jgi:extracellular factor (EF) 3-hydroxypalmitic acid methyl ester biosynthesis protein
MRATVESFFAKDVPELTRRLSNLAARVDPAAMPQEDEHLRELDEAICQSRGACRFTEALIAGEQPLLRNVQQRFRDQIAEWFDRSWFMFRAKQKPRGYPGDYELLTGIYDRQPKTRGLGGYLDLYFLNTTLARAVRARLKAAKLFLVREVSRRRGDVAILNVACGPCREYVDGLLHPPDCRIHVTCIDADRQALEYVRCHVATVGIDLPAMDYACYNALRMSSARNNIRKFGSCDIIYSIGLCDYIPDKYLVPMLRGLRDSLNRNGVLYVALKDADRYDKTEYQWHVDWHFYQRTEENCLRLFRQAGFHDGALEMARDETGVIMNFTARVKRPTRLRVDVPKGRTWEAAPPEAAPRVVGHTETVHE